MLPHSYAAEYGLLAAIVLHGTEAIAALEGSSLRKQDFYQPEHALLVDAILACKRQGMEPSWQSLAHQLVLLGAIDEVDQLVSVDAPGYNAEAWLVELMQYAAYYVPSPAFVVPTWARMVSELAARRRKVEEAQALVREAHNGPRPLAPQPRVAAVRVRGR